MDADTALVIPAGVEIRGRVVGRGAVRVDGRVEGELEAHEVVIGPSGDVVARISATRLEIEGTFVGVAHATQAIVVRAGASASGRLEAPRVDVSPDALVDEASPRASSGRVGEPIGGAEEFEAEVTQRLQLGGAAIARLRASTPTPTPAPSTSRRPPTAPRPPTRARLSLKPRGGA